MKHLSNIGPVQLILAVSGLIGYASATQKIKPQLNSQKRKKNSASFEFSPFFRRIIESTAWMCLIDQTLLNVVALVWTVPRFSKPIPPHLGGYRR